MKSLTQLLLILALIIAFINPLAALAVWAIAFAVEFLSASGRI